MRRLLYGVTPVVLAALLCQCACTRDGSARAGSSPDEFTLVLMTDTHLDMKCSAEDLEQVSRWIVDHAEELNIRYVAHLGDVGDVRGSGDLPEMLRAARAALQPILDAGIPLSVAGGNHDYREGDASPRSADAFNAADTFGPELYAGRPWFGGTFEQETGDAGPDPGGAMNHYLILDISDLPFLFLTLEYYPRDKVMVWADRLVRERYPDRHVVVCTHSYLTQHGALSESRFGSAEPGPERSNSGAEMWERYLKNWSNLRFVFNGHFIDTPRQSYLRQTGAHGNVVHAHFFNYQNWGYDGGKLRNMRSGGPHQAATIRLVTIQPGGNAVRMRNFLPPAGVEPEPAAPAAHPFIVEP